MKLVVINLNCGEISGLDCMWKLRLAVLRFMKNLKKSSSKSSFKFRTVKQSINNKSIKSLRLVKFHHNQWFNKQLMSQIYLSSVFIVKIIKNSIKSNKLFKFSSCFNHLTWFFSKKIGEHDLEIKYTNWWSYWILKREFKAERNSVSSFEVAFRFNCHKFNKKP